MNTREQNDFVRATRTQVENAHLLFSKALVEGDSFNANVNFGMVEGINTTIFNLGLALSAKRDEFNTYMALHTEISEHLGAMVMEHAKKVNL